MHHLLAFRVGKSDTLPFFYKMKNENSNPEDPSWDVFRYVAGEMSSDEEARFEQLLEHDQSLREEVAGMVCMMAKVDQAHTAVEVSVPDRNRRSHSAKHRVRRVLVSVAALALLATLAVTLIPKSDLSDSNAESVAIAWAESIDGDEFELTEQNDDFEFASIDFDGDDDWIVDAMSMADIDPSIN